MAQVFLNDDDPILMDPDAKLTYSINWGPWLAHRGQTGGAFTWTVSSNITKVSDSDNGVIATILLSSGTIKQKCTATCHIVTTEDSFEDDRTLQFLIGER